MANATSEREAFTRGLTSELDGDEALDVSGVRYACINNLNHAFDSSMQHLVNINGRVGGKTNFQGDANGTVYSRIALLPPMQFPLRILGDGSSARVLVRLYAYISAAGTATFRLALRPPGRFRTLAPSTGVATVGSVSTTSTSATALSIVELYYPTVYDSTPGWLIRPSADALGRASGVLSFESQLEVWAITTSAGFPRIEAIHAREWIA